MGWSAPFRASLLLLLLGVSGRPTIAAGGADVEPAPVDLGLPPSPEARIERAIELLGHEERLFEAYRLVYSIYPVDLEGAPPALRLRYGWALARAAYELGRHDETMKAAEYLLRLSAEAGEPRAEMYGRYYRASGALADPDRLDPKPLALADLDIVSQRAEAAGSLPLAVLAHLALGKLKTGEPAIEDLRHALRLAEQAHQDTYVFRARSEIARQTSRQDPAEGDRLLREALGDRHGRRREAWDVYGWQGRLEVIWAARSRPEAIEESRLLLDRIEAHRREQEGTPTGSMGFFSSWVAAYRRVAGYLLQGDGALRREDVELAFDLTERMRGRVLLEQLQRSGATGPPCATTDSLRRRAGLRRAIVFAQQQLRASDEKAAPRMRREIESLMLTEEAVERGQPCGLSGAPSGTFVELRELERSLAADEALLEYQIGGWTDPFGSFDGGSWVFVVTSAGTRVVSLPDSGLLRIQRDAFLGALRSRDGAETAAAVALHAALLRDALAALPAGIARLVVVPHGPVEGLPMAPLRATAAGPALIDRYSISYAPSATLWRRWRTDRKPGRERITAVADPSLELGWDRLWPHRGTLDLRPLAGAREEVRQLRRGLSPVTVLQRDAASERALKLSNLGSTGFLLFAAHAVVDEAFPRRSAIVLASGDREEDGLLQPPEIAELPLEGAIVVLSACQSATGRVIEGEGLLSLTRSFLQAGATSVLGNLWPERDDEAAAVFGSIYRYFGTGNTLAEAVRRAQQDQRDAGVPLEGWAGVILLGDGDALRPPIGGLDRSAPPPASWWALLLPPAIGWLASR